MAKSTKILAIILMIVFGIVGLVLLFSTLSGMTSTITDAGNSAVYPNNCSLGKDTTGAALTLNLTSLNCANSTGNDLYAATMYQLPLAGFFSPTGIILTVILAIIFIVVFVYIIRMVKNK